MTVRVLIVDDSAFMRKVKRLSLRCLKRYLKRMWMTS